MDNFIKSRRDFIAKLGKATAAGMILPYVPRIFGNNDLITQDISQKQSENDPFAVELSVKDNKDGTYEVLGQVSWDNKSGVTSEGLMAALKGTSADHLTLSFRIGIIGSNESEDIAEPTKLSCVFESRKNYICSHLIQISFYLVLHLGFFRNWIRIIQWPIRPME